MMLDINLAIITCQVNPYLCLKSILWRGYCYRTHFFMRRNWGSWRLSDLSKITQLLSGRFGFKAGSLCPVSGDVHALNHWVACLPALKLGFAAFQCGSSLYTAMLSGVHLTWRCISSRTLLTPEVTSVFLAIRNSWRCYCLWDGQSPVE